MAKDFLPIFTMTKWRGETERYAGRISRLTIATPDVNAQLKRFPGLLSFCPSPEMSVKHRGLVYTNQLYGSAIEVLRSIQLLWAEGHFLCAGHCVRLLYEIAGGLRHFQTKVLERSMKSEQDAKEADAKLQNLMLATNAPIRLPAGIEERYKVISSNAFVQAGEAHTTGFEREYGFLCDISHPTFMHFGLYTLHWDHSWSNTINVEEIHNILERITKAAEDGARNIESAMVEIYDACVPDIETAIARTGAKK